MYVVPPQAALYTPEYALLHQACVSFTYNNTRSSADAVNALDAFSGQSRPCRISDGTLAHVRHMTLSRYSITMSRCPLRATRYGQLTLYTLAYTTLSLTLMSTKPNPNPSLTLTLCAIVDVAPAAANTLNYDGKV